ncbi:MAG: GNAT family N-acetyltransferase [Xanthomonadales bacterium]|nr:GNAT family N-acetyltransferase [Xanthomonadaceae bacterium]MBN8224167.1 GNAT family N-acetyltransferase [Xanthomonadales bacterium]MCA0197865.1 GNAT family N-acetyltransferase [Pseudomonadota bacterium]HRF83311.1 GNAT family N-acetyltransferase [Pseudoxanthomonas sp.]
MNPDGNAGFILRPWRTDDLDALLKHANDPWVPRGLSDRFPHPYTRADGQAFLAGHVVDFSDPVLAIEIAGEACGGIALRRGSGERAHGGELGYWLGRAHWGHGWMTRVVAAYLDRVVPGSGLLRVEANVLDTNPASARVLEKNGFVEEGLRRGAVCKPDGLHDLRLFGRCWPR